MTDRGKQEQSQVATKLGTFVKRIKAFKELWDNREGNGKVERYGNWGKEGIELENNREINNSQSTSKNIINN